MSYLVLTPKAHLRRSCRGGRAVQLSASFGIPSAHSRLPQSVVRGFDYFTCGKVHGKTRYIFHIYRKPAQLCSLPPFGFFAYVLRTLQTFR